MYELKGNDKDRGADTVAVLPEVVGIKTLIAWGEPWF